MPMQSLAGISDQSSGRKKGEIFFSAKVHLYISYILKYRKKTRKERFLRR